MRYLFDVAGLIGWAMLGVGTAFEFGWPVALILDGAILLVTVIGGLAWKAKRRSDVSR